MSLAMVGKVDVIIMEELVVPAGMMPGQRITVGSRMPPSQQVPLPSRRGPAFPGVVPVAKPRAVVARVNNPSPFVYATALQRGEHFAYAPVHLQAGIAV